MNPAQIKCLAVFALFAIIGFGPVSPGCLIGMYIVARRPQWFRELIGNLYINVPQSQATFSADPAKQTRRARIQCFLSLLGLFIVDIAPIPVTPIIAFGIILGRPLWFYHLALTVYGD